MQPSNMQYDSAITVFSPDGRLFQVEYAREAVKRGSITVGLKYKTGIVLITDKRISSKLIEHDSIDKIFQIDGHIGCTTSGLVADARILVNKARIYAQMDKITYDEEIPVKTLVKRICDFKHIHTQYGGVRPFGTSLIIGGVDEEGAHLFATDPSGAFMEFKAGSEGSGQKETVEYFEKNYVENMTMDEAIDMGIKAIQKGSKWKINPKAIEIAAVTAEKKYQKLSHAESKKHVKNTLG